MNGSIVQPHGWWNNIPASIDRLDVLLTSEIKSFFSLSESAVETVRFLTEKPTMSILTILIFFIWHEFLTKRIFSVKTLLKDLSWIVVALGILDFFTSQILKPTSGRLKPLHLFYDPNAPMHLSFPSSHGTAAGFLIFYWLLTLQKTAPSPPGIWAKGFQFTMPAVFGFSAISRIVVGQHYFLDVFMGFAIGVAFAFVLARLHAFQSTSK